VEDQHALLDVMAEYLTSMGYKLLKAHNGPAALEIAQAHPGQIHVLLTDVVMPGMRGTELAAQVISHHPEARIIYMSGYSESHLDDFRSAELIHKPIDLVLLADRIRRVLNLTTG